MQGEFPTPGMKSWDVAPLQPNSTNNRGFQSSERGKQITFHPGYFLHKCKNIFEVQLNYPYPHFIYNLWKRLKAFERPGLLEGFWPERSQQTGRSLKQSWSPLTLYSCWKEWQLSRVIHLPYLRHLS